MRRTTLTPRLNFLEDRTGNIITIIIIINQSSPHRTLFDDISQHAAAQLQQPKLYRRNSDNFVYQIHKH